MAKILAETEAERNIGRLNDAKVYAASIIQFAEYLNELRGDKDAAFGREKSRLCILNILGGLDGNPGCCDPLLEIMRLVEHFIPDDPNCEFDAWILPTWRKSSKKRYRTAHDAVADIGSVLRVSVGDSHFSPDRWAKIWPELRECIQPNAFDPADLLKKLEAESLAARAAVSAMNVSQGVAVGTEGDWPPPYDAKAMMSCSELADKFDVSPEALKKKLERWRRNNDDGWKEFDPDRRNEPRIRYEVGAVIGVITEIHG